ncbi:MAG: carbon starvation protein A, partial [Calditrichia bacterium]|nr:carbon starvation protein A [Calditrichia bacterium]
IAGAGPIVGPIIALAFGWLPVYLWILIGVVFIGAVHDFTSLIVSLRNEGKSIGEIIENNIGVLGKRLFLAFSWSSLILVIAVFLDIVAKTFTHNPAVASASILFIILAVIFGLGLYKFKMSLGILTIIGVIFLFLSIYVGIKFPIQASETTWILGLLGYIFMASILPVWILLQPRDYLNSFLLYTLMAGALIGIIFFNPQVNIDSFTGFSHPKLGSLFPILFITVACGAISGFHSLVASGTTSKQLNKENDAKIIGFGGMLLEGVLAVVAIIAAASLSGVEFNELFANGKFIPIFASGVSKFLASLPFINISENAGKTFTAMAVSAFALTSLDTATRLSRFAFQEFFETKEKKGNLISNFLQNRFFATFITVSVGATLLFSGGAIKIWPLFGSANQLLAAIALLAVSVWLSKRKVKNLFTLIPMFFMFIVTISALITLIYQNLFKDLNIILAMIAFLLLVLSFILA